MEASSPPCPDCGSPLRPIIEGIRGPQEDMKWIGDYCMNCKKEFLHEKNI